MLTDIGTLKVNPTIDWLVDWNFIPPLSSSNIYVHHVIIRLYSQTIIERRS